VRRGWIVARDAGGDEESLRDAGGDVATPAVGRPEDGGRSLRA
jgi:hypothetical protein